eukprot:gene4917-6880_t
MGCSESKNNKVELDLVNPNSRIAQTESSVHFTKSKSPHQHKNGNSTPLPPTIEHQKNSVKAPSFQALMGDNKGRDSFMKFLKAEHAEENLIFFQEVENIKKMEQKDLAKSTQDLVSSYLLPGVETEVNVSDNMKKNLANMVNTETEVQEQDRLLEYLNKAQNEIVMIMALGSYPRFMKSDSYKEWLQAFQNEANSIRGPDRA